MEPENYKSSSQVHATIRLSGSLKKGGRPKVLRVLGSTGTFSGDGTWVSFLTVREKVCGSIGHVEQMLWEG